MPFLIRKQFKFEAAHQLEDAYTKACSDCIHGHSYTAELVLSSKFLGPNDMVVDFGELKPFINSIREQWDHGLHLHDNKRVWIDPLIEAGILKESKVTFWRMNPTAEAMARSLYNSLCRYITDKGSHWNCVTVVAVRVHETSTGWGEWRND